MKSPYKKWLERVKSKPLLALFLLVLLIASTFGAEYENGHLSSIKLSNSRDTVSPVKSIHPEMTLSENLGKNSRKKKYNPYDLNSIWDYSITNSEEVEEISLFIFNDSNQIDSILTNRIKSEFKQKNYIVTDPIIHYSSITPVIANKIKSAQLDYFRGKLYRATDYICVGIVSYDYKPNYYRKDITDCIMQINYYIYSASTGAVMFSERDKIISSGISKKMARLSAIQNFVL